MGLAFLSLLSQVRAFGWLELTQWTNQFLPWLDRLPGIKNLCFAWLSIFELGLLV
jgi:hypothetical protein